MAKAGMKRRKSLTAADIARVGPGTPGGEWFRRYWVVVGTAQELYDIPQAVKILGEDLVLFRDQFGKVGLARVSTARIAARRWNTVISKTAACAVLTTAGYLTFTANAWRCRRNRRTANFARK